MVDTPLRFGQNDMILNASFAVRFWGLFVFKYSLDRENFVTVIACQGR